MTTITLNANGLKLDAGTSGNEKGLKREQILPLILLGLELLRMLVILPEWVEAMATIISVMTSPPFSGQ